MRAIPVVAIKPSGELAGYFENMTLASRATKTNNANISHAVRDGYCVRGLKWMKEEDYRGRTKEELAFRRDDYRDIQGRFKKDVENPYKNWFRTLPLEDKERIRREASERLRNYFATHGTDYLKGNKGSKGHPVVDLTTGKEYAKVKDCARDLGVSHSLVSRCCSQKRKIKGHIITYKKFINN